jgi:hypothetical protein
MRRTWARSGIWLIPALMVGVGTGACAERSQGAVVIGNMLVGAVEQRGLFVAGQFRRGAWRSSASRTDCTSDRLRVCTRRSCERRAIGPCVVVACDRVEGVEEPPDLGAPADLSPRPLDLGAPPFVDSGTGLFDLGAPRDGGLPPSALPETLPSAGTILVESGRTQLLAPPRLCACSTDDECAACPPTYSAGSTLSISAGEELSVRAPGDDVPAFRATVLAADSRNVSIETERGEIRIRWSPDAPWQPVDPAPIVVTLATASGGARLPCTLDDGDVVPLRESNFNADRYGVAMCELSGSTDATIPEAVLAALGDPGDQIAYSTCGRRRTTIEVGGWDIRVSSVAIGPTGNLSLP